MRNTTRSLVLLLAAATLLAAARAEALPRYAGRYGQKCLLCHNNPSGGGMRSAYASQYLVPAELSLQRYQEERLEGIDPYLNERISIGADMRTLYTYANEDERKAGNNFFQMQGDVYLHFQADERFSIYLDQGIRETGELYGLAFVLPAGGYVKAGRFVPAYGWRFADHKAFVRDRLGFAPPGHADVGIEAGVFPGDASLTLALVNGSGGQLIDGDNRPALVLRGEVRRQMGPLNLALGASYYRDEEDGVGMARQLGGPFGYLVWGPLSWLGEWDWESRDDEGAPRVLVTSQEIAWSLRPGLALRGTYNFLDPDLDLLTGSQTRLGIGVDLLATPFAGVLLMYNHYDFEAGTAVSEEDHGQLELVTHFLY